MAVLATFSTVTGSLKAAGETVKAMIDLRDAAVFHSKAIELQQQISAALADAISAYESQTTALQRVRELEEKVAKFEKWDAEKNRYEMKNIGWGATVYMLKPEARSTEPPHWVCAHCYQKGEIFIIQNTVEGKNRTNARRGWFCPSCHNEIEPMTGEVKWLD